MTSITSSGLLSSSSLQCSSAHEYSSSCNYSTPSIKVTKIDKIDTNAGLQDTIVSNPSESKPFMEVWIAPAIDASKNIDAKEITTMMRILSPQDSR